MKQNAMFYFIYKYLKKLRNVKILKNFFFIVLHSRSSFLFIHAHNIHTHTNDIRTTYDITYFYESLRVTHQQLCKKFQFQFSSKDFLIHTQYLVVLKTYILDQRW